MPSLVSDTKLAINDTRKVALQQGSGCDGWRRS